MIQAVFFDLNGVIIDDELLHLKAFGEALREEGVEQTEAEYFDSLGMDNATFVQAAFERAGRELADEVAQRIIEAEAAKYGALIEQELPLAPGAVNFVKALAHHYALGLVSMSSRSGIDYVLRRAQLDGRFTVIVSAEDVGVCKPDPTCYNKALELLNAKRGEKAHILPLRPEECLAIEDSPPGIRSARTAGMRTLGVTNTVSEKELRDAGANVVTRSLFDWTHDAVHHVFDTDWGRR